MPALYGGDTPHKNKPGFPIKNVGNDHIGLLLGLAIGYHQYMHNPPPKSRLDKSKDPPPRRIQTQIHRRNKAKAVYPLTDEWENSQESPPKGLKRPPEDMPKS
ncbi:hypothetical protein [Candidatus Nitronereus thalassa]|uniref:Uncharacterized protein n=1 Tax=Candidatus Nitronereus thalassa TaxID=3020898 RepID=A0ABU3K7C7_9BACT|nr:hypothetical protein [Candidatus Nitronereus thalassa]MDT7042272.1 hypothetical protein [Candidatus Nitronereus thalassa]